ncbi:uncharacterized protein BDV17DRAFT_283111 [Aspergillus undulatus]|uniref:uncharacterized protein n=1 Tax=Aspergillus undulatus TaxID=1810928 RepID=UPI003CCDFF98
MAAVNVLKRWFDQHRNSPYPSKEEKLLLADQSGLTVAQVTTWFANTRRRRKCRPTCQILSSFSSQQPIDIKRPPKDATYLMSPMERWRNSPPEAEAASFDAIMGAVAESEQSILPHPYLPFNGLEQSTPSDLRSTASSNASESAVSHTSASSVQSVGSHSSNGSFARFYVADAPQRRRRRKRTAALPKQSAKPVPDPRPYQCTFCTDTFRTKYDWTRHEKTLHLSLESYTCCPSGPSYTDNAGVDRCVFCDSTSLSESHFESHSFSRCQEKPEVLRTFYRKDHFVQHLRLVHGLSQPVSAMDGWKAQIDKIKSRCGLCNENFLSWSARNDHIAQHFRDGAMMKDWRGSRGLDPAVALSTENAMPPYLIGIESVAPDPFSASLQTGSLLGFADDAIAALSAQTAAKPSPFAYFTVQLCKYVRGAQNTQEMITDDMLQRAARRIVFGDEDPWNQTPADNIEWLTMFKQGMGLDSSNQHNTNPDDLVAFRQYCADDMYMSTPGEAVNGASFSGLGESGHC